MWERQSGRVIAKLAGKVNWIAVPSEAGWIASSTEPRKVWIRDVRANRPHAEVGPFKCPLATLATPRGEALVVLDSSGYMQMFDARSGERLGERVRTGGASGRHTRMLADGRTVLFHSDGTSSFRTWRIVSR